MKEACRQVLGIDEFDESIFLAKVETITVHKDNILIFLMKDGNEIGHTWEFKSTARTDCWTKERRNKISVFQKKNPSHKKGTSCLTGHIRCEKCGDNFRRQTHKRASGEKADRWYCTSHCGIGGIFEDTLHGICADAMGLSEFDEAAFNEQIDHVGIVAKEQLTVYFKDGRTYNGTWSTKKRMPPLSEEHKRCIGEASRKYWRDRRCRQEM